jgi:cellulose synthase/poly-beta-1,6-N-acetylglucosamine synthase-like glycosyltransferase
MSATPDISVVMAVFNAARFLRPAIESILAQTHGDFEFIIVDDGSTDDTAKIAASYSDPRIRFVAQAHKGLVATLNHGVQLARGEFVARMDGDDLSHPRRLQKQLEFMRAHPQCAVVGTTYEVIYENARSQRVEAVLLDDEDIRAEILARNPFAHGSVMMRRAALELPEVYRDIPSAEDWDLWLRLSQRWRLANLPEVLYSWRQTTGSVLQTSQPAVQRSGRALQQREYLRRRDSGTLVPASTAFARQRKAALLSNAAHDPLAPARVQRLAAAFRGRAAVCLDFGDRTRSWRELAAAGAVQPFSSSNLVARIRWLASWLFFWKPSLVNDLALWLKSRRA